MPEEVRRVVAGMDIDRKTTEDGNTCTTRMIKFSDKLKALELLGRHFKMWTDRSEITGKDGESLVMVGGPAILGYDEWGKKAKERLKR